MTPLASYALRRLAQAVPVALLIVLGNFILLKTVPGDLVDVLAGESRRCAHPEYMAMLRTQFGLDQPDYAQFAAYFAILHLDLGFSFRHNMPVSQLILDRLPATLLLMTTSILWPLCSGWSSGHCPPATATASSTMRSRSSPRSLSPRRCSGSA